MNFDAAIFDMDGVITKTAVVHSSAWKRTFDEYLLLRKSRHGETFREFTPADYLAYVDGRPRYNGVDYFLKSRGIEIPYGDPTDEPGKETVCGLGNRKNEFFRRVLGEEGAEVYPSTIQRVRELRQRGVNVAVATSSKNCVAVLDGAGIADLFDARIDGLVSAELGLQGKPEPDIFITACGRLGARPARAMIVEDAVSGIQAAVKGHFGLVLGIARENNGHELLRNGADIVVGDLSEISIEQIDCWFTKHGNTEHDHRTRAQETI